MVKCNPRTWKVEKENNILRLHFFYFMIMKNEFYTYSINNDKECIISILVALQCSLYWWLPKV